jgi:hypothetical protein
MNRILLSMTLIRNFASDLIGGVLTTAALFALLCSDFAIALFRTIILGQTAEEQEGDA